MSPILPELTVEQYEAARQQFEDADRTQPRADAAHFDAATGRLTLEMRGGAVVSLDPRVLPSLANGTDEQLAAVRVMFRGSALFWDELDAHFTTDRFVAVIFGIRSASELASKGGRVRSAAKSVAARANGAKGGRPRKAAAD